MSRICYVCNKATPQAFFLTGLKSKHSKRTCVEIIDEILACFISRREIAAASNCICMICFGLIEEYDFHCMFVESRKQKLRQMLVETESVSNLFNNRNLSIKRTYERMDTNGNETNQAAANRVNRLPDKIVRMSGSNERLMRTAPSKPSIKTPVISEPDVEESIISEIKVEEPEFELTDSSETPGLEIGDLSISEPIQLESTGINKTQPQCIRQKQSYHQYTEVELNNRIKRTQEAIFNGYRKLGFQVRKKIPFFWLNSIDFLSKLMLNLSCSFSVGPV